VSRKVLAVATGAANPFGPLSRASIAAVTTCFSGPSCAGNRLIRGSALRQCGQVFSQNTTAVGLPNKDANVSRPLPVRFLPLVAGGGEPIRVVGSGSDDCPGEGQLDPDEV
jgi:hypothetical protein